MRDKLGIRPGDEVIVEETAGEARVRRVKAHKRLRGLLKDGNRSSDSKLITYVNSSGTRIANDDPALDGRSPAAAVERVRASVRALDVDADLVLAAAWVKAHHAVSYADAFAVTRLDPKPPSM